jgi:hypothetical protein
LFVVHESIAAHVAPSPPYPALQAQLTIPAPVDVQWAVRAHPPLFVAHALTPVHVMPLPV